MAITKADILLIAPELSGVSDAQWAALIAYAYKQTSPEVWGDWLDMGATYLVAHLATLGKRGGSAGAVQSESVGQVSRTYATVSLAGGAYGSTAYGQEFERLAKMLPDARLPVIG